MDYNVPLFATVFYLNVLICCNECKKTNVPLIVCQEHKSFC